MYKEGAWDAGCYTGDSSIRMVCFWMYTKCFPACRASGASIHESGCGIGERPSDFDIQCRLGEAKNKEAGPGKHGRASGKDLGLT